MAGSHAEQDVMSSSQSATVYRASQALQLAMLSHELRTPLNTILGSISLLERQHPWGCHDRVHLDRLQRSSRRLVEMLDDVLALSSTDSPVFRIRSAAGVLGAVVAEALADAEPHAIARPVTLTNGLADTSLTIPFWGDEARVRQILVNVLMNAIKFTAPGGTISVRGGRAPRVPREAAASGAVPWVFVTVADTGRGIPESRLETIFEPFQQAEPADRQIGTGLGLAIGRALARAMGGDLEAQSTVGVGSIFTLWLPERPH